jgi:hypothetical protein
MCREDFEFGHSLDAPTANHILVRSLASFFLCVATYPTRSIATEKAQKVCPQLSLAATAYIGVPLPELVRHVLVGSKCYIHSQHEYLWEYGNSGSCAITILCASVEVNTTFQIGTLLR